ncbi:MAG: aminodeoxychorismate synthase component I, partial [Candidatus Poribacteria bacterium]|nr:aminodeoxychorismate synthase component I [Candidatus Poribacteria bacterium]
GTRDARSDVSRVAYEKAVASVREYIAAGDVYQVNLTRRISTEWEHDPYALYARLRESNPAPFSAYGEMDGYAVVSSSPERFLKVDAGTRRIETRPIKGTRPRGRSPEEDARNRQELLDSEKDAAELLMIVDLERNDLGRICEYGSVRVSEMRSIEAYASVVHTVATVEGTLRPDTTVAETLRATFPGGSITGAPKIRAMQLIDALEANPRGVYTGSIGYIGFDGGIDLNVAIRTVVVRDGEATFGVGGGIVWDSDPEAEYRETLDKADAIFRALGQYKQRGSSSHVPVCVVQWSDDAAGKRHDLGAVDGVSLWARCV